MCAEQRSGMSYILLRGMFIEQRCSNDDDDDTLNVCMFFTRKGMF